MSDEETAQAVLEPFLLSYRDDGASKIWLAPVDCAPLKAAIVAALQAERERCAKICDKEAADWYETFHADPRSGANSAAETAEAIAAAIRAPLSKSPPTKGMHLSPIKIDESAVVQLTKSQSGKQPEGER